MLCLLLCILKRGFHYQNALVPDPILAKMQCLYCQHVTVLDA